MAVRFTKNKHRFVVTENSCRVYRRIDNRYISTERLVSPQKRTGLIRKHIDEIEAARKTL
jgi:hypothetical protein